MSRPVPTGVESRFDSDEILVSKTDTRGVITYANPPFIDISGYTEEELIGTAHSVVRHPDMPRCVFGLLWDRIASGSEIFAYVKNLRKDGGHYWVFAHVTPDMDPRSGQIVGYHSCRRQASSEAVRTIEDLYDQLRKAEARAAGRRDAAAVGQAKLEDILAEVGQSYDQFVLDLFIQPKRLHRAA